MHVRTRGLAKVGLVMAILVLATCAGNAKAWTTSSPGVVGPGSTFGPTTPCANMSGFNFQQNGDFCFYFPNGSTTPLAMCDPSSCGQVSFLFPSAGTFTANLTYPAPFGFNVLELQLCHDNQLPTGDPARCPQTLAPGGADAGCTEGFTPGDNGTPDDLSDDTMTTTLTCTIPVGDSVNPYTLIVFPDAVLNCSDADNPFSTCVTDLSVGVTATLTGSFSSTIVSPGPADAKATGGGELAPQQHFSLQAMNNQSHWDHTHIRYAVVGNTPTRCTFSADGATFVDVEPTPLAKSGGTADVYGNGIVTDATKVKHNVTYHLHVTDGGKGGTDTFQLTAPGCDTAGAPVPVNHGNIDIHPDHDND